MRVHLDSGYPFDCLSTDAQYKSSGLSMASLCVSESRPQTLAFPGLRCATVLSIWKEHVCRGQTPEIQCQIDHAFRPK